MSDSAVNLLARDSMATLCVRIAWAFALWHVADNENNNDMDGLV